MFRDAEYPAEPYPGARPDGSFVHVDRVGLTLTPDAGGWSVEGAGPLDEWLAARGGPGLRLRVPILAYGSNACPSKITWLRDELGLEGPVIVLRATTHDIAAVWAAGLRVVDDQRAATLAAAPGTVEHHAVWLATDEQRAVLDVCEGRGQRYDLAALRAGTVTLETGETPHRPLAYVGRSAARMPLLVRGVPVRCADVPQRVARHLVGDAATTDGLDRQVLPPPP